MQRPVTYRKPGLKWQWKFVIFMAGLAALLGITNALQYALGNTGAWTTTGNIFTDWSIYYLDIIPGWCILCAVWMSPSPSWFKGAKYLVYFFLGYWLIYDWLWHLINAGITGTFDWNAAFYFDVPPIAPNTPMWAFLCTSIAGFAMSLLLLRTAKSRWRELAPFVLYLVYAYALGGITQVIAVPDVTWWAWTLGLVPAIAITWAHVRPRRPSQGPALPSPAAIKLLNITKVAIGLLFVYIAAEVLIHFFDDAFGVNSWQLWLLYAFGSPWIVLYCIHVARRNRPILLSVDENAFSLELTNGNARERVRGARAIIITMLACTVLNVVINVIANFSRGFTFSPSQFERFMYAVTDAIAEESFRIGIITAVLALCYKLVKSSVRSRIPVIIAAGVAAIVFSAYHWWVYGDPASPVYNPNMMIALVMAGFVMGIFYGYTRNPLVPFAAHVFVNAFASMFSFMMAPIITIIEAI